MAQDKNSRQVRRKAICECGLKRKSMKNMTRHAAAANHKLVRPASKSHT